MLDTYNKSKGEGLTSTMFFTLEVIMKNLVSFNQLKNWSSKSQGNEEDNILDSINEYFECITECDIHDLSCKRECRLILS